jgi:hypothetical protein
MRKFKGKILVVMSIILISTMSFAIYQSASVPIYLEIPEYLKITHLSKGRLDLYATSEDVRLENEISDSLTFNVESNINYNMGISFEALTPGDGGLPPGQGGVPPGQVKNAYNIKVNYGNDEIINLAENDDSESNISPGVKQYTLTFFLKINKHLNPSVGNKIGDITITVLSI